MNGIFDETFEDMNRIDIPLITKPIENHKDKDDISIRGVVFIIGFGFLLSFIILLSYGVI